MRAGRRSSSVSGVCTTTPMVMRCAQRPECFTLVRTFFRTPVQAIWTAQHAVIASSARYVLTAGDLRSGVLVLVARRLSRAARAVITSGRPRMCVRCLVVSTRRIPEGSGEGVWPGLGCTPSWA